MKNILTLVGATALVYGALAVNTQAQIVVDNSSPGFSASTNWLTGLGGYGGSYRYRTTGAVADSATWQVPIKVAGTYSISAWWAAGANRTTSAPYIVYHASGTTTVLKNQQVNGGQWNTLGMFTLNTGWNQVKLSPWTTTGYIIVADAIRWN